MQWFVQPDTVQVSLPGGQWMLLKKRLTIGEHRKALASAVDVRDGKFVQNAQMLGIAEVEAYLVDWSLTNEQGKRVPVSLAAIQALSRDAFDMISDAIEAHIRSVTEADEEAKKSQVTESALSATS